MRCRWIVASFALACLTTSPGWGQTQSEQVQQLLEQMQSLQDKLKSMENAGTSSATKERSTQLGRSRIREEEPEWIVRIYDLSDLLAPISPYPAMLASDLESAEVALFPSPAGGISAPSGMGMMGGMGGGMGMFSVRSPAGKAEGDAPQSVPSRRAAHDTLYQREASGTNPRPKRTRSTASAVDSARIDFDSLINAIKTTIEPTSWDDTGGLGSIAPLGNSLIVSANPKTHDQITVLLDSFRKRWGTLRTISVQAHWLWLTEAQLAALLAPAETQGKAGELPVFGLIDAAAWEARAKELPKADHAPPGYQAVVTCYNGQTVHTVSGEQRAFVTGMTPVLGSGPNESGVGYEPTVATLQEGAALQVTPMVTSGGKYVVLDVHSRVVRLCDQAAKQPDHIQQFGGAQDVAAAVDRPVVANHHLETTLRVPVDRRMLVGGMTYTAQPKAGEPGLYLFVKLAVQELRDDRPEAKPESKPASKPTAVKPQAALTPVKRER